MPDTELNTEVETQVHLPARSTAVGAGRVLVLVYGFFTLAAGARSGVQLATQFAVAPLAYLLSAAAAAIYASGCIVMLLADRAPARRSRVRWLCRIELAGVFGVGMLSLLVPAAFPDATVWSHFGSGYAFVPAVLPFSGCCGRDREPQLPTRSPSRRRCGSGDNGYAAIRPRG